MGAVSWVGAYIKYSEDSVWRQVQYKHIVEPSGWELPLSHTLLDPHVPRYHTPYCSLCRPLSFIQHLLLFTMYHYGRGLTWDRVSSWLRAINNLAKRNRVLAKVFPSTPAIDSTLMPHRELFTSALSCPWLQTCRVTALLDFIGFKPKVANKALAVAHSRWDCSGLT